jgi:hypothetical protein
VPSRPLGIAFLAVADRNDEAGPDEDVEQRRPTSAMSSLLGSWSSIHTKVFPLRGHAAAASSVMPSLSCRSPRE